MTNNEQQFEIEARRSLATIEDAIIGMDLHGGNIQMFAYTMLRASAHLFAEVHSLADLERAASHLVIEEHSRRQLCGRA